MSKFSYVIVPNVNGVFDFKLSQIHFDETQANQVAVNLSKKYKNLYVVWKIAPKVLSKIQITQCLNGEVLPLNEWK